MADFNTFDPIILIPFLGGLIGISVGLVTIWSSIKTNQQKQKSDTQAAAIESEDRIKEYFDLRIRIVETKIEAINNELHTMDDTYTNKLEDRSRFFTEWVERLEQKMADRIK